MYWNWKIGGLILGLTFLIATVLVKPIGVSTQFVILDGIVASAFEPGLVTKTEEGYVSTNAYLNKSGGKYAKSVAQPMNYGFIFVLSMILGGFLGRLFHKKKVSLPPELPVVHAGRFGSKSGMRYALAFAGGFLVLWGARLAGGCTSGHMMSGMMQTSVSGYIFALSAFVIAVPVAMIVYNAKEN